MSYKNLIKKMFASNQIKESNIESQSFSSPLDPLTIWLIRISCLLIIVVFSSLLLGIPLAISFGNSILNETVLNVKDILRNIVETGLA